MQDMYWLKHQKEKNPKVHHPVKFEHCHIHSQVLSDATDQCHSLFIEFLKKTQKNRKHERNSGKELNLFIVKPKLTFELLSLATNKEVMQKPPTRNWRIRLTKISRSQNFPVPHSPFPLEHASIFAPRLLNTFLQISITYLLINLKFEISQISVSQKNCIETK